MIQKSKRHGVILPRLIESNLVNPPLTIQDSALAIRRSLVYVYYAHIPGSRKENTHLKAAIVLGAGQTPVYGDFSEPVPSPGENRIAVTAAAISHVVKSRASGAHYSSSGGFPFVAGIDGVGRLDDGRRVYFILPKAPYGSMAEKTVAPSAHCVALPDGSKT